VLFFKNDYSEGAHPLVLSRLVETNMEKQIGYGEDEYCAAARQKIAAACGKPDANVFFISGGTQTNATVIASLLSPYQGAIAADTGHINGHEAGAIEYRGHKVLALPHQNGKLNAADVESYLKAFYANESYEHMVFPGMVYISHPTEYGTLYTKAELTALSQVCKQYDLPLFMDGARLGYGLVARGTDVTLQDVADLCDVFYIGGTKVGALCGEAVIFTKGNMPKHFLTSVKKRGALVAKGRLLGVQFDALFTDDLYFRIGRHAIEMAEKMKGIFRKYGIPFFIQSPTNQQFVILENRWMKEIGQKVAYSFWEKPDDEHTVVRFATGWSTTDEDLQALDKALSAINNS